MRKIVVKMIILFMFICVFVPQVNAVENDYDELNTEVLELLEKTSTDYHYNFLETLEDGLLHQEIYNLIKEFCIDVITNYETDIQYYSEKNCLLNYLQN